MGAPENKSSIEQVNQVQKFLDIANQGRIFGDNLLNQLSVIILNFVIYFIEYFKRCEKRI